MGISPDELVSYVDRAVDQMADIVTGLGDDLANRRPALGGAAGSRQALPGANSPYAILRHCLGVMEFWGGQVVAGRVVQRDRAAEFVASGPVDGLVAAAKNAKDTFRADVATADPAAPPRSAGWRASGTTQPGGDPDELEGRSQGSALLHVLEEITQHLGQMELTRDVLREGRLA